MRNKLFIVLQLLPVGGAGTHLHAAAEKKDHPKIYATIVRRIVEKSDIKTLSEKGYSMIAIKDQRIKKTYPLLARSLECMKISFSTTENTPSKEEIVNHVAGMAEKSVKDFLNKKQDRKDLHLLIGPFFKNPPELDYSGLIEYYVHGKSVGQCMAALLDKNDFSLDNLKKEYPLA